MAKLIAKKKNSEWLATVSVDAVQGIILEQILNDPLNGYDFLEGLEAESDLPDVASGLPPKIELVKS